VLDTIEKFYIDGDTAVCDGGSSALGHPRVYLAIDGSGQVTCPYCGRVFVRDPRRAGASETVARGDAADPPLPAASTQY
jgi:uncharacterized Zn-finger protein